MKKINKDVLTLIIAGIILVGYSFMPKWTVNLTKENFSKYVATNTQISEVGSYAVYNTYFIGADDCKFVNCTVSYNYVYGSEESEETPTTIKLSISGDGETIKYAARTSNFGGYKLVIQSVTGRVKLYRL